MSKFLSIIVVIVLLLAIIGACSSDGGYKEPWKEIGTTKSEYMEAYNYFRYGN